MILRFRSTFFNRRAPNELRGIARICPLDGHSLLEQPLHSRGPLELGGSGVDLHPEVTRVFHRDLTRLKVMFCGLCLGQDMRDLPFRFGYC